MITLFGKNWTKEELQKRIGNIEQIGGIKLGQFTEGKEKGVKFASFKTGTGFDFNVLIDRAMDISSAFYKGNSLCWKSATGEVSPKFYDPYDFEWLRSFYGGLLTTCGLTYIGSPVIDEGEKLGLHGRISNIPATNISLLQSWQKDDYIMSISGKMNEVMAVVGLNISLTRTISAKLGENKLYIHDIVENEGFKTIPHMILYHINIGFPVLDENAEFVAPIKLTIPRDKEAEQEPEFHHFCLPQDDYKEKCYYHKMKGDNILAGVVNEKFNNGEGLGIYVKYQNQELPYFIQWKMAASGNYVMGTEPANAPITGRDKARKESTLPFLKPGEKKEYSLEIGVLTSVKEIVQFKEKVGKIGK